MSVSVVVPIYNAEKYLDKCIKSILNQTFRDLELILVNDGSKDRSLEICYKYERVDNRVRVINKDNEGSIKTRRRGVEEAKYDFIMFVDADDWVSPFIIEKLKKNQEETDSDIVIGNTYQVFNSRALIKRKNNSHYFDKDICYEGDLIRNNITEAYLHGHPFPASLFCKLYRKELLLSSGNYLSNITFLGEDLYYNLEMFLKVNKISIITDCLYYYRMGGNTSRYMSYHFSDIVEGYKIQKQVIQEYYMDSYQKRMNGISIMLLNSFKTTLLNLYRSSYKDNEICMIMEDYCNNDIILEAIKNEGAQKYFESDFINAINNRNTQYLSELGKRLYKTSKRNNRIKQIIKIVC